MKGIPATRPNNSLSQQARTTTLTQSGEFEQAILSAAMRNMIAKSMPDEKARARFTANLISIVSQSEKLQECKPATIIAAALRGEGMGLIINHGYYVVPYKETANFQISYKGYAQLAMETGKYADIDCIDVREGEYAGRDPRTGKQRVDFSTYETEAEREQHPIVGYYAYFELKSGMFRGEYWSIEKCIKHAEQYSQAFKAETFYKLQNGEPLTKEEQWATRNGSPWYDLRGGFERMCKKTVLKSLLNSGYAPLSNEVRVAMAADTSDLVIPAEAVNQRSLASAAKSAETPVIDVDVDEDGAIIETAPEASESPVTNSKPEATKSSAKASRNRNTAQAKQETAEQPINGQASLFDMLEE